MQKVSVIIPTRNRAVMLRDAIQSILTPRAADIELEVIIVDDGSTDNTADIVHDFPVIYVTSNGQGVSVARNIGIAAATGDFIAFLDDDDVWCADYPIDQIALLNQYPEYGAVVSRIMMADENLQPNIGPFPEKLLASGWMFDALLYYVPGVASLVIRAAVVHEIGGFDPTLHGSEDWDWILKIAKRHQIGFSPN